MKPIFGTFIFLTLSVCCLGQSAQSVLSFRRGYPGFVGFIKENMRYPAYAREAEETGIFFTEICITKDGKLVQSSAAYTLP